MLRFSFLSACVVIGTASLLSAVEWKSGIEWPEPPVIDAGGPGKAPSDAIVLFDGKDMSQWNGGEKWEIADGIATSKGGGVTTKQQFGAVQVHLEWASPEKVSGEGQGRGNSGLYLMDKYEVQILDSHNNKTYFDGQAAAIYKQSPPLVNVSRKPGEWQTYDVIFHPAKFASDGKVEKPATVTVLHNGVLVQDHFEILGNTNYDNPPNYEKLAEKRPLSLQFHGNPVRFRNIWVRELKPLEGRRVSDAFFVGQKPSDKKETKGASRELAEHAAREFFVAVSKKDKEKALRLVRESDRDKIGKELDAPPKIPEPLNLEVSVKENKAQVKVTNPGSENVGLDLEFADGKWWVKPRGK